MSNNVNNGLRPLCVDLDGTLVKTDTFVQALLWLVRTRPATLFSIPIWARSGLAAFKKKVAEEVQLDPAALPYQIPFLEFLIAQKRAGRHLVLATASDEAPARAVANHLHLFDTVFASDGAINLKSARKRDLLVAHFGERGFDYAGNARADWTVWESAATRIVVNPSASVRRALRSKPAQVFDDRPVQWRSWTRAFRIRQWTKNVLIFLPMILAHEWTTPLYYLQALIAFLSFSFLASAIYGINDLMDLHADQHHPRKCHRPFAAGNLSVQAAVIAIPGLALISSLLAQFLSPAFGVILLFYLLLTTLYSWQLKQWVLWDVLTLAAFYALRIFAGTAAYGVETSGWLIAFSIALFFSLALVKRYAELREALCAQPEKIEARGRGYHARHLPWIAGVGVASGVLSSGVLALYINSEKVVQFYRSPALLWGLCPMLLYWIGRIWRLAIRGELSDDPLEFAIRDWQTLLFGGLGALILWAGSRSIF